MTNKVNRVVYRFWHSLSPEGLVGYIGKDVYHPKRFDLRARARQKKTIKLYRALKKYPISAWRKEVLARGFRSDKALAEAEIFWIAKFDSKNKGYNCTDGGEGNRGHKHSEETKRKLSKFAKTRIGPKNPMFGKKRTPEECARLKHTPEQLAKMSEVHMGKKNPMYGKNHTPETKKKMRLAHLGKKFSEERKLKMRKPKTALHAENISKALKGRVLTPEWRAKISKSRLIMMKNRTPEEVQKANEQLARMRAAKLK